MTIKNIIFLFLTFGLVACSTQKNTWLSRNYNALTARYNILHNGEQSLKHGIKQLQTSRVDNYMEILPLFSYSGNEQAGLASSDMERAVDKGFKVIQKKSITVRPQNMPKRGNPRYDSFANKREFNPVVKEAYLLVGKAHLYNHNFIDALSVLDYAAREFSNETALFEILLWTARTRIEMGQYENARAILDQYDAIGDAPTHLYGEYNATYAALFIGLKQYTTAIPFVKTAAEEARERWDRIRRYYILGQLNQLTGQNAMAMESFHKVIKLNPPYEMALNANINYATTAAVATGNYAQIRADLLKIAGQTKNEEYRDQLHYAIATSYLHENDTSNAILHLKLSAGYNYNNLDVKRETYIALASLYYDQRLYIPAYNYYDSTLTVMSDIDTRNNEILYRHAGLTDLATELKIIEREDSLQWLASLPMKEREDFVDAIIEKERIAALSKSLNIDNGYENSNDPFFFQNQMQSPTSGMQERDGKWYFYNQGTMSMGKMEFERKWGRRPLQDNWRRSDLSSAPVMELSGSPTQPGSPDPIRNIDRAEPSQQEEIVQTTSSEQKREDLLADIPTTPEMLALSKEKKAEALFNSGLIFLQHFNSYNEAQKMFQQFIKDHSEHKHLEEVLFWNYMACTKAKNQSCILAMRKKLSELFPDGHYAAYANDSTFGEKQLAFIQQMNNTYKEAFEAYQFNNFEKVKELTTIVKNKSDESSLIRKSYLLGAMANGKSGDQISFENDLKHLASSHPQSEEGALATRWLNMLNQGRKPVQESMVRNRFNTELRAEKQEGGEPDSIESRMFTYNPQSEHYFWIKTDIEADINQMVFNIADYNFNRFLLTTYEIKIQPLASKEKVIVIGPFNNANEVMDYYFGVRSRNELFKVTNSDKVTLLAGSEENKNTFLSSGDIRGYQEFFSSHYLKSGGSTTIELKYVGLENQETPEETATSSPFTQEKFSKIAFEIPSTADLRRVATFMSSQALNKMRLRLSIKQFNLRNDQLLIVAEEFPSEEVLKNFISDLQNNNVWKSFSTKGEWLLVPINQPNVDEVVKQGSTKEYVQWIQSLNK